MVFFCKSGVRSKMAAELAKRAGFGGKGGVGEYPGSWKDWEANGGKTEKGTNIRTEEIVWRYWRFWAVETRCAT